MEYFPQIALGVTIITAVWGHAIWLSNRFAGISQEMDKRFEKVLTAITSKLEYHERHDDQRFGDINNGLWEIRLQNALSERHVKGKKAQDPKSGEGGTPESL
jgi:hypothetical protein